MTHIWRTLYYLFYIFLCWLSFDSLDYGDYNISSVLYLIDWNIQWRSTHCSLSLECIFLNFHHLKKYTISVFLINILMLFQIRSCWPYYMPLYFFFFFRLLAHCSFDKHFVSVCFSFSSSKVYPVYCPFLSERALSRSFEDLLNTSK